MHGIELSPAMVAQLQAKSEAENITVTIGDFATARVGGTFRLAYLVYNTDTNLTTQDEQVECFCNVARHLEPGGVFVIELEVPPLQRLPPGETVRASLWTHRILDSMRSTSPLNTESLTTTGSPGARAWSIRCHIGSYGHPNST